LAELFIADEKLFILFFLLFISIVQLGYQAVDHLRAETIRKSEIGCLLPYSFLMTVYVKT